VTRPTVVFHVGMAKTGSSAIQHVLAANAGELAEIGVHIPWVETLERSGRPTGGNAESLYRIIKRSNSVAEGAGEARAWLEAAIAPEGVTILSSEFLSSLSERETELLAAVTHEFADATIVLVLRDVYDHAFSVWSHMSKEGLMAKSFDEFCKSDYIHPLEGGVGNPFGPLSRFSNHFDDVRVGLYTNESGALATRFFELVGIEVPSGEIVGRENRVNPSMSLEEVELVRVLTDVDPSGKAARRLSDSFLRLPRADIALPDDPEALLALEDALGDSVRDFNERFIGGQPILQFRSESREGSAQSASPVAIKAVEVLGKELAQLWEYVLGSLEHRLLEWEQSPYRDFPEISEDFDPIEYLRIHSDVLLAGVNPYEHYARSGKLEGRILRDRNSKPS
jgi:hypothetical protein